MTRPTLAQMLASGDIDRLFQQLGSWAAVAKHLGVNDASIRKARIKARERMPEAWEALGERYQDTTANDFEDEEPTQPGVPLCSNDGNSTCDRPPIPLDPVPQCFTVREVASQIDADGNLEKQWLGARRDSKHFETVQPSIPSGHGLKGISTLVDERGNVRAQWIKTSAQNDEREGLLDSVRRIADEWAFTPEPAQLPQHSDDDLLCVYPMGDPHLGMLAWAPETGENFDLAIAERNLVAAVDHLALLAPPAKRALVLTVGDTFHSDGLSNTTTKGTRVDVDGRTRKMIDVGIRTFRRIIDRALVHHEEVEVKIAPGNHDALLSVVLQVALQQFYEREPRVHVDPSAEDYLWYEFGLNLLGVNHGHRAKADSLMQVMAVDCARQWGRTRHRRMYTGHVHHETTKEVPGCTVDTLNTLASSDDWHRRQAYRATRHMRMDIIHREFGLINRHIVGIDQLLKRAA